MPRPFLLAAFLVLTVPAFAQLPADRIDALLAQYHDVGRLNGVVLVGQGDDVAYVRSFGDANMEWDVPNTPDTRFRIGSVTKQFTAALILRLAEEGKLDLHAPITTVLPDYPAATGDRITAHHLLSHTAGVPNYTGFLEFIDEISRNPYTPTEFVGLFSGRDLDFEPGAGWAYSNSGYFLLGVLVEELSGMPYDRALRHYLLDPLGLADTGYDHAGEVIERRAAGYERRAGGYANAPYLDTTVPYAAGSIYSTARDLHRWTRALHTGAAFAHDSTLVLMTTPVEAGYAYGLAVRPLATGSDTLRVVGHSGGINGFRAMLDYVPEDGYTIVVLDNTSQDADAVADALLRTLYGLPTEPPKPSIADELRRVIEAEGIAAAEARYRDLKATRPDAFAFGENELNGLGYVYLRDGDTATALRIFQLNVEAFPDASNPYDSLGEAYLAAGDTAQAITNYGRSVELNPGNANGRRVLERLGVELEEDHPELSEAMLDEYVGRYEIQPGFVLAVTREGAQLYTQATGQPRVAVYPSERDRFYLTVVNAQLTFNRGASGEVESVTLHQGGHDIPAPRVE